MRGENNCGHRFVGNEFVRTMIITQILVIRKPGLQQISLLKKTIIMISTMSWSSKKIKVSAKDISNGTEMWNTEFEIG